MLNASPSGMPVIALIDPEERHGRALGRLLRSASATVRAARALSDIPEDIPVDVVIADHEHMKRTEREELMRRFGGLRERCRLLLLTSARKREEFQELLDAHRMTNFLATEGGVDLEELLVTVQKILRKNIFGLEKYFPWSAEQTHLVVASSAQIPSVLDLACTFGGQMGVAPRLVEAFRVVVEELCTNAIYNAPVDPQGKPRHAHFSRAQPVTLGASEFASVDFFCDGRRLGVSVSDPFGALKVSTLVAYLAKCFRGGEDQVDQKAGGAGLGLYAAFANVTHFVVNVQPGKRTEMLGLLDVRGAYRDFAQRGKSFNIFLAP